ncbi:glycoside hydrolase family 28 protein [Pelagicoccus enzymogenes]|nr:glycoside hydrolase family 28 protein [Pelagicoccus enzymogenes]
MRKRIGKEIFIEKTDALGARVAFFAAGAALLSAFAATGAGCSDRAKQEESVGAETISLESLPFEMPEFEVPDFSESPEFSILAHGAKPDDGVADSKAIAAAIDAAHEAGGGKVVVPAGHWSTGKIHLKSNVCLYLEEGAVLEFSSDPSDYLPAVRSTWEGMECYNYSPLIYAFECENVGIAGSGKLLANLDTWSEWYKRPPAHMEASKELYHMAAKGVPVEERDMTLGEANMRPQFIQFNRCKGVRLEGISIENSPFWVIHPYLSQNILIRGVTVKAYGHNNDGVDPEMSQNILIEDCVFDQGDDAIAIKSGRNQDAWRLNTPTRNVVVRNCLIKNGHQLCAIGSELSGGVENVLIENCTLDKSIQNVGHLLFIKTNERRGGFVRNIHMRNIVAGDLRYGVLGIETDVLYQWRNLVPTYERRLTPISDIYLDNVEAGAVKYVSKIQGQEELPVERVNLKKVSVAKAEESRLQHLHVNSFVGD